MDSHPALELFLKSIPLFSLVESADMMDLLRLVRPVNLTPGQVLFRENDLGQAMWILGAGCEVSISSTPPTSKRPVVVGYARGGETVGEMALVDDAGRSGTAVVMNGGLAHQIDAVDFHALRDSFNPAAFKVLRRICVELCARLRATSDRIVPAGPKLESPPLASGRSATIGDLEDFVPFRKLPQVVKLALTQQLQVIETQSVQPIFGEGEKGDSAFFIISGEITIGRNGRTLANLGSGAMFGLISVIDQGARSASGLATGPTRLLRMSKHEFETLFAAGNRFAYQMVDLVSRQLVARLRLTNKLLPPPGQGTAQPAMMTEDMPIELEEMPSIDVEIELDL